MLTASTGAEVTCLSASRVKGLGQLEDTLRQVQQLVKVFINLYIKKPLQLLGGGHVKVESGWPDYKIDIEATFGLWATAAVWRGLPAAHHTQQAQPMQLLGASWLQVARPCQSRAQATKCWCCCRSREHLIAHPDFRIHTGRTCVMGVSACTELAGDTSVPTEVSMDCYYLYVKGTELLLWSYQLKLLDGEREKLCFIFLELLFPSHTIPVFHTWGSWLLWQEPGLGRERCHFLYWDTLHWWLQSWTGESEVNPGANSRGFHLPSSLAALGTVTPCFIKAGTDATSPP